MLVISESKKEAQRASTAQFIRGRNDLKNLFKLLPPETSNEEENEVSKCMEELMKEFAALLTSYNGRNR